MAIQARRNGFRKTGYGLILSLGWFALLAYGQTLEPRPPDALGHPTALSARAGITLAALAPDGRSIAWINRHGQVELHDAQTGELRRVLPSRRGIQATGLAYAPSSRLLAALADDGKIDLWNLPDGTRRPSLRGHHGTRLALLAFSPQGDIIATAAADHRLKLWRTRTGTQTHTLPGHHAAAILALNFTPDGRKLASLGANGQAIFWDTASGLPLAHLTGLAALPDNLDFDSRGTHIAAIRADGRPALWDIQTGEEQPALPDPTPPPGYRALGFAPGGGWLAGIGDDGSLHVWDMTRHTPPRQIVAADGAAPTAATFAPSSGMLAVGDDRGRVTLWNPATGQSGASLTLSSQAIAALGYAPNSRTLLSLDHAGQVTLWTPPAPAPTLVAAGAAPNASAYGETSALVAAAEATPRPVAAQAPAQTAATSPAPASLQAAIDPCATPANPIVGENCKTGNPPAEWDINGEGDASIQGYATDISVNKGATLRFKVATNARAYRLDIYRLGYYGGLGARKIATVSPSAKLPQTQPACLKQSTTGLVDCGNWAVSASWAVPATAVSGIYIAKLVRTDTGGASHSVFVVRDDAATSPLLFQTSDTTWQAYNTYGGNSFYTGAPAGRAYKLSYNRPFNTRGVDNGQDWLFNAEYPFLRWLEANGYDVGYSTGVDSDRRGALIKNHKVFLSIGHDEYWSFGQRANVEAARDAGVHLAFFSGNEVFWKTRWENSIATGGGTSRTLVCYKETHANAKIDPTTAWTGTWRDPRFSPPADGNRPENALTGTLFIVNDGATTAIQVPEADGKLRFWRHTALANLAPGSSATLPNGTLGYEWDIDADNGVRPAGLVSLSNTTIANAPILQDYGSTFGAGTANHHLSLYRRGSALVFGAGTVQWSWGLDSTHDRGGTPTDANMQQATVNLLADMGAQPATPQAGLQLASASTDTTAPGSVIVNPTGTVAANSVVTITGTASDSGGRIGGVEVSVDGGTTWHPATGRESWSYAWTTGAPGTATINSRAVDDSGNLETPGAGKTITVGSGTPTVPPPNGMTLWPGNTEPAELDSNDPNAVELGLRFRSDQAGHITGIRFYKSPANTGTHVGHLWTNTGTLLGTVTFGGETPSDWQQANFATPIAIAANTLYVVSYHTNVGHYSDDIDYFTAKGMDNPPLHAPASGVSGLNGVYNYGGPNCITNCPFPTLTWNASNYWVDVVFGN